MELVLLSDEDLFLLRVVLKLRRRGWGWWRIGRFLVEKGLIRKRGLEAAKKWVMRFVHRYMERLGVSSEDELWRVVEEHYLKPQRGILGHFLGQKASTSWENPSIRVEEPPPAEDLVQGSGDSWDKYKRLGCTERLVLAAFSLLHRAATPKMLLEIIRKEYPVYGAALSRAAVVQALRRLVKRGLVRRLYHPERRNGRIVWVRSTGYYELVYASPLLVENFRVDGSWIWSKETMGRPAPLNHALGLAAVFNKQYPVEAVELKIFVDGPVKRVAEKLRRLGWTYTAIYYDSRENRVNVEARFHYPPLKAHPLYMEQYRKLYLYATSISLAAIHAATQYLGMKTPLIGTV